MTTLPSGTVTFFMSDIEGSTRLVGRLGADFPRLLDEHFAVLGAAIEHSDGTIVSSEGDSVFAVFPSARGALTAAIEGQRAMAAHEWPDGVAVRVRIGLHAGEAMFGGRDYTGIDVHRTARIMGAGHGGQILVSDAARALAGEDQAAGISFRDLGVHTLRDLPAPERIFCVVAPGIATDFPPLRTAGSATPTNLPTPLTGFVGRARELAEVREILERERLVTLTGPGGTGKTRLAIETARSLADRFEDGVWFVALDVVRDPALVLATIAATLALPDPGDRPIAAVLAEHLAPKRALLVLDNLEQVIEAGTDVSALLQAAPRLAVIASSREPLAVDGEHVYPVPPLGLPDEPGVPTAADIGEREAVVLFVERARAARAGFSLTDANAPAVAGICRRLDGLPLALELAAARLNLLSPEQVLARLDHRLALLSSSRRDLPDRQRTLRGAIDWSHDLLAEPERRLFRRFSVFAGGADLEALAPVVDADGAIGGDALDLASALVDRSLLRARAVGSETRIEMLETIREYAAEQLAASGEAETVARAHAMFFRGLALASERVLNDPRRDELLERLELELANVRAAVAWALRAGEPAIGLEIATPLRTFWYTRGHLGEGRRALGDALEASASQGATPLRTRALAAAAELAAWHTDYRRSFELARATLAMAEEVGDPRLIAYAKMTLGWATLWADPAGARRLFDESLDLARPMADVVILIGALQGLGVALIRLDDLPAARTSAIEAVTLAEASGDHYINAMNKVTLGTIDARLGNQAAAMRSFAQALRHAHEASGQIGLALALDAIAQIAIDRGDLARAVQLASGAARLRAELGGSATMALGGWREPLDRAREVLAPEAFDAAAVRGRTMTTDEIVAVGLAVAEPTGAVPEPPRGS